MDETQRITLAGMFIEIAHGITVDSERYLVGEFDLPLVSFEVLIRLHRTPGNRLRLADLADQVTMTRSGLTRAVDRLESEGLVRREQCPSDGRGTWAVLTQRGTARITPVASAHAEHLHNAILGALQPGEQAQLLALLEPIRDRVNPLAAAASRDLH